MRSPGEQERSALFPTSNTTGGTFLPLLACDTKNLKIRNVHRHSARIYQIAERNYLSHRRLTGMSEGGVPQMRGLVEADPVRYRINENYRVGPS